MKLVEQMRSETLEDYLESKVVGMSNAIDVMEGRHIMENLLMTASVVDGLADIEAIISELEARSIIQLCRTGR